MEIQLRKLFQPRRYRSHHRSPARRKISPPPRRAYQSEIDFSLPEEKRPRFVAERGGRGGGRKGGTARVTRIRLGRLSKVRGGRAVSLIFKFAFVDRARVSVSLRNFIPLAFRKGRRVRHIAAPFSSPFSSRATLPLPLFRHGNTSSSYLHTSARPCFCLFTWLVRRPERSRQVFLCSNEGHCALISRRGNEES